VSACFSRRWVMKTPGGWCSMCGDLGFRCPQLFPDQLGGRGRPEPSGAQGVDELHFERRSRRVGSSMSSYAVFKERGFQERVCLLGYLAR